MARDRDGRPKENTLAVHCFCVCSGSALLGDLLVVSMAGTELRGHEVKVYKPQVHLDIRKYFFSVRIVDAWNSLLAAFLCCNSVKNFKRKRLSFQGSGYE